MAFQGKAWNDAFCCPLDSVAFATRQLFYWNEREDSFLKCQMQLLPAIPPLSDKATYTYWFWL